MSLSANTMPDFELREHIRRLSRECDRLHGLLADATRLSVRAMDIAEQRGYRRGVEDAARVAERAHMVPPDGGSPTEDEKTVADEAARRILALLEKDKAEPSLFPDDKPA